uniref:Uncharacterized protein n=1 Tax=Tanacetum cinerariifolium TaxID=118510 RepID=A0A699I4V4_TANCI|nr:hypothetical protein [Tanacetum cinerariifolium]
MVSYGARWNGIEVLGGDGTSYNLEAKGCNGGAWELLGWLLEMDNYIDENYELLYKISLGRNKSQGSNCANNTGGEGGEIGAGGGGIDGSYKVSEKVFLDKAGNSSVKPGYSSECS